jgi:hypothetical protein
LMNAKAQTPSTIAPMINRLRARLRQIFLQAIVISIFFNY